LLRDVVDDELLREDNPNDEVNENDLMLE